jgi:hypothetical protein
MPLERGALIKHYDGEKVGALLVSGWLYETQQKESEDESVHR